MTTRHPPPESIEAAVQACRVQIERALMSLYEATVEALAGADTLGEAQSTHEQLAASMENARMLLWPRSLPDTLVPPASIEEARDRGRRGLRANRIETAARLVVTRSSLLLDDPLRAEHAQLAAELERKG
jgi:hypothetical protein